jgi:hypothetical protein
MKTGKTKKLALEWKKDERFNVAVLLRSSRKSRPVPSPTNVLVLSEAEQSFVRILTVAEAA